MDTSTGLAILGSAIGGANVVEKLLGPTSEYVGVGLKNWTERRVDNVKKIFAAAAENLGGKIDEPGAVPPKVLKEVMEEGSFNDDQLACEYFGGVLASSRTPILRDDRGASLMKLVSNLTTYQVRTHFIFYAALKKTFEGQGLRLANVKIRQGCSMYVTLEAYERMMDFGPTEDKLSLTTHAIFGLFNHGLVQNFEFGSTTQMKAKYPHVQKACIEFTPSVRGVELFMWACGQGALSHDAFLLPTMSVPSKAGIELTDGFLAMSEANKPPAPT